MTDESNMEVTVAGNCARVEERIAAVCARAGRDRAEVQLVAVSKGHGPDRLRVAAQEGLTVFGESKVQEARLKIPALPGHLRWHMIGHLQTNKVKLAVQLFEAIHSVDSLKLLAAIQEGASAAGITMNVFLEVNVSGELSKFGLPPESVPEVLEASCAMTSVSVLGLMTIPPFTEDPEKARPHFVRLRAYRDEWADSTGIPLEELSMGMSHDFEVAIEEGATCIRVGTDIFGTR